MAWWSSWWYCSFTDSRSFRNLCCSVCIQTEHLYYTYRFDPHIKKDDFFQIGTHFIRGGNGVKSILVFLVYLVCLGTLGIPDLSSGQVWILGI
jgi:hypothetical protein